MDISRDFSSIFLANRRLRILLRHAFSHGFGKANRNYRQIIIFHDPTQRNLNTTRNNSTSGHRQQEAITMLSTRHRVAPTLHPNNHEFRARYSMASETRAVVVGKLQTTGLTTWEVMEEWVHKNVNAEGARRASRWIVEQANVRCNLTVRPVVSLVVSPPASASWECGGK